MAYELKIAKFGLYPVDEPTCYQVGFSAVSENGRSTYRDTEIALDKIEGLSEDEILNVAWKTLGATIEIEMEVLAAKSAIIGQVWEPSAESKAVVAETIKASRIPPVNR